MWSAGALSSRQRRRTWCGSGWARGIYTNLFRAARTPPGQWPLRLRLGRGELFISSGRRAGNTLRAFVERHHSLQGAPGGDQRPQPSEVRGSRHLRGRQHRRRRSRLLGKPPRRGGGQGSRRRAWYKAGRRSLCGDQGDGLQKAGLARR